MCAEIFFVTVFFLLYQTFSFKIWKTALFLCSHKLEILVSMTWPREPALAGVGLDDL